MPDRESPEKSQPVTIQSHQGYHTHHYPRFGSERASRHAIRFEWQVPDEAFMTLLLDEQKMRSITGIAKYRPEFAEAP